MNAPRRENDSRRKVRSSGKEDYFRRMMEETPAGRMTPSDVAHINNTANRHSGKVKGN